MARSDRARLGAALLLTAVVGGLAVVLLREEPSARAGAPEGAAPALARRTAPASRSLPNETARVHHVSEDDGALEESLTRLAEGVSHQGEQAPGEAQRALLAHRDPIDFRLAFEEALVSRRLSAPDAVRLLEQLASEPRGFPAALVLASHLGEGALPSLFEALATGPREVRPLVVFALRGSNDPAVDEAFVALFARGDDEAVRKAVAFALADRAARLDPRDQARLRSRALRDLAAPATVVGACDVLGALPLDATTRPPLEDLVAHGLDGPSRLAALRALATGGVDPTDLAPTLDRVARDATAPPELKDLARGLLARR